MQIQTLKVGVSDFRSIKTTASAFDTIYMKILKINTPDANTVW